MIKIGATGSAIEEIKKLDDEMLSKQKEINELEK